MENTKTKMNIKKYDCPFCGKKNCMPVNLTTGYGRCYVCGYTTKEIPTPNPDKK